MREIKFRAWDKKQQQMFSHKDLMDCTGGAVPFYRELYHAGIELPAILLPINQNHIVLMQYIELKDVDGRDIYEGDIQEDGTGSRFQVKYGQHEIKTELGGMRRVRTVHTGWYLQKLGKYNAIVSGIEIPYTKNIGNIFENPELLEV